MTGRRPSSRGLYDGKVRVSTPTRVRARQREFPVTVVAVSAQSALLHAPESFAPVGACVDLFLPSLGGQELEVLAGIESVVRVKEGFAVSAEFIVVDESVRRSLHELMALLLLGDGGGRRAHPRVIYDVPVRYGASRRTARLEELSMGGALVRMPEAPADGATIELSIPHPTTQAAVRVSGRVANVRIRGARSFAVGIAFDADSAAQTALAQMLSALLER